MIRPRSGESVVDLVLAAAGLDEAKDVASLRRDADRHYGANRVNTKSWSRTPVRGRPACVISDNGTEVTSTATLRWSQERGATCHYVALDDPQ